MEIESLKTKNIEDIYNSLNEEQKKFWKTSVIDSKLRERHKEYFIGYDPFNKKDVITWGELVILNPIFLISYQRLICWREDQAKFFINKRPLRRYDSVFTSIKKIFQENGITGEVWDMLKRRDGRKFPGGFPKKKNVFKKNTGKSVEIEQDVYTDIIDVDQILKQDLYKIAHLNPKSMMYKELLYAFQKHNLVNHKNDLKVEDVLKINNLSNISNLSILRTLLRIQQVFERCKLTEKYGPFMKLKFV